MKPATLAAFAMLLTIGAPAAAQTTSRPGPWLLDVRGVTSPVPADTVFYPPLEPTALIPTRGFGLDVGGHVYLFNLGGSRVGVGAAVVALRATTSAPQPTAPSTPGGPTPIPQGQSLQLDMVHMSPQVSFNFGSHDGWSYVSAGMGSTVVNTRTAGVNAGRRETGELWELSRLWQYRDFNSMNVGGGARWFLNSHVAFGFDVRLYRIAAGTAGEIELALPAPVDPLAPETPPAPILSASTPGKMILTVGAGFSIR